MDDPGPYLELLGTDVTVVIDRPLGSAHPDYPDLVYRSNYGYVPGTLAGDGEAIDAYVLGPEGPVKEFRGRCIAVIQRRDDNEHKLVVAAETLEKHQIERETWFVEQYYDSIVLLPGDVNT
ncbi:MAG: inorganic diphosphatase [Xanthomonadales bacterium]|nr:inorganic diphosphatase [Xanthomonadales bacterium]